MTEKRIIDDAFMELTDIHSKSSALQAQANYLQCSRVSAQDLDYDSVLSVFETALNYISAQLGEILTRIEVSGIEVSELNVTTESGRSAVLLRTTAAQL